jgi:DNA invertase Pin-like site-specific DNA recombinase
MVTTKRALIYCRISQDREGAGLGVDRQRKDCEGLARRLGWQVVTVHTDNDASAYSGKVRTGYRALLDDLGALIHLATKAGIRWLSCRGATTLHNPHSDGSARTAIS